MRSLYKRSLALSIATVLSCGSLTTMISRADCGREPRAGSSEGHSTLLVKGEVQRLAREGEPLAAVSRDAAEFTYAKGRADDLRSAASNAKAPVAARTKRTSSSGTKVLVGSIKTKRSNALKPSNLASNLVISKGKVLSHRIKDGMVIRVVTGDFSEEAEFSVEAPPPLAVQWVDCMVQCMGLGWRDALSLAVCCMFAVSCPWCVGAYGAIAGLCGSLCLVYAN